jgi:HEPN domain-containing protein
MNIEDATEWITLADNDFDSAKLLNDSVRRHYDIICYHCAQAVEKYLKGYLIYNDIVPRKTHDLLFLNNVCIEKDKNFDNIVIGCGFLNRFSSDIRYPHKYETDETDANFSIDSVEKIRNFEPILELREIIDNLKK